MAFLMEGTKKNNMNQRCFSGNIRFVPFTDTPKRKAIEHVNGGRGVIKGSQVTSTFQVPGHF